MEQGCQEAYSFIHPVRELDFLTIFILNKQRLTVSNVLLTSNYRELDGDDMRVCARRTAK